MWHARRYQGYVKPLQTVPFSIEFGDSFAIKDGDDFFARMGVQKNVGLGSKH
jgi:hypothetical protein